ncbi:MAG: porin family protein [Gallionellaceae bacterium]|nr:porin family protein [Gallionellaceae bacterium]
MKKILAVALLSAFAAPAFAADNGFYAGVTLGRSSTGNDGTGGVMTKSTDTVAGILAGYQFTKNWGAEVFYTGAGKWDSQNTAGTILVNGKADAWGMNAVGTLPLSGAFSLYGKLGYAGTKSTLSVSPAGSTYTGTTRNAVTYGLGGVCNVTPAVGVRLGWDHYGAATSGANVVGVKNDFNAGVWSLGAVFKF